ncbi:radical SAM protein, partial [Candidatus Bipolaricaulota bacterium]|nr:radical SAM protein [Candidatus Bipolaricaulota bacterium]
METEGHVFGPVPSRRLGRSLGINNIPPKVCSYSCVYCQLGRTPRMEVVRRAFYGPEEIVQAVRAKVGKLRGRGEQVDYLTFVPDGEPTLDANLGREIE